MKKLLTAALGVASLATAGASWSAPVTWSGNGHQYEVISSGPISWADARAAAQGLGSDWDLATITSQDEQLFVAGLLGTPPPSSAVVEYVIGGFDSTPNDGSNAGWSWVTGEAFNYTFWGAGEPNNGAPSEGFIGLDNRYNTPNWGWNDYNGSAASFVAGFVAERHAVPAPAPVLLFAIGLLALSGRRKAVS